VPLYKREASELGCDDREEETGIHKRDVEEQHLHLLREADGRAPARFWLEEENEAGPHPW
jgi:hypothetical protein